MSVQLPDSRNENILIHVGGELLPREDAKISVFDSAVQGGDAVEAKLLPLHPDLVPAEHRHRAGEKIADLLCPCGPRTQQKAGKKCRAAKHAEIIGRNRALEKRPGRDVEVWPWTAPAGLPVA